MSQSLHGDVAWLTIGQGKVAYAQEEAEAVLAGFAFGTTHLTWPANFSPPKDNTLGAKPRATLRANWAYRIYDLVPSEPSTFEVADLFLVAALDARVGSKALLAMEAILPELNETLAEVDVAPNLLDTARS